MSTEVKIRGIVTRITNTATGETTELIVTREMENGGERAFTVVAPAGRIPDSLAESSEVAIDAVAQITSPTLIDNTLILDTLFLASRITVLTSSEESR